MIIILSHSFDVFISDEAEIKEFNNKIQCPFKEGEKQYFALFGRIKDKWYPFINDFKKENV